VSRVDPRLRTLHVGDMIFMREPLASVEHAVNAMEAEGWKYSIEPMEGKFLVICTKSGLVGWTPTLTGTDRT
jgi:hypothetical protein